MSAAAALNCCCGQPPPPGGCTSCQSDSLFCGESCFGGFGNEPARHAIMAACSTLEIISADSGLGWSVLNGRTVEATIAPIATNGVFDRNISWSSTGGGCTIGGTVFQIQWAWNAVATGAFCADQFGCEPYSGAGSFGFLRITATTGASVVIREQTVLRPVNPCDPGEFDFGFANVRMFHQLEGATGFLTGPCDSDPPPPPTHGACCHGPEGTQCSDTSELECQQLNGTWFPGVDCTQVNCTTPIGACCYEDNLGGHCVNTTSAQCSLLGGTWYPPPATCANTQCQFGQGGESRGLGDTVAKITSAFGVKPCAGCKKRQDWLNRVLPYGKGT